MANFVENGVCFSYTNVDKETRRQRDRGKNLLVSLFPCSLVLVFALCLLPSALCLAQDPSALQRALEANITNSQALLDQREQEIASLEAELGETSAALGAQLTERDAVSNDLARLREEQATLLDGIATVEAQLAETQGKLNDLQLEVESLKVRVQELLVNVYKQRSGRYARVLTQADSLHDLQVKNYYLSLLSDQDVDLITELNFKAIELVTTQETLNQQLAELQTKKTALEGNQVALEIKQGDLETIIAELDSTREGQLASQKDLLESQASLEASINDLQNQREAEIQRLKEEAARKREEAQQAASALEKERLSSEADDAEERATNLAAPPAMASDYASPVSNAQIFAPFGEYGSCLALQANTAGAAVLAVQPGVVLNANFLSANDGYLVSLQHADGTITAYSNLQARLSVQSGDQVAQGDILGYLGGGGIVPNDVLKFYMRVASGSYVDPAKMLGF